MEAQLMRSGTPDIEDIWGRVSVTLALGTSITTLQTSGSLPRCASALGVLGPKEEQQWSHCELGQSPEYPLHSVVSVRWDLITSSGTCCASLRKALRATGPPGRGDSCLPLARDSSKCSGRIRPHTFPHLNTSYIPRPEILTTT